MGCFHIQQERTSSGILVRSETGVMSHLVLLLLLLPIPCVAVVCCSSAVPSAPTRVACASTPQSASASSSSWALSRFSRTHSPHCPWEEARCAGRNTCVLEHKAEDNARQLLLLAQTLSVSVGGGNDNALDIGGCPRQFPCATAADTYACVLLFILLLLCSPSVSPVSCPAGWQRL